MLRVEAASDEDDSAPNRQTTRQFLNRLYFITKRYNMIVVFIRITRPLHTDEPRSEKFLRHPYGSRARCRREKEHLTICGHKTDHGAYPVQMLLAKESVELVQNEQLYSRELQLAEAVQFLHTRCGADDERGLLLECFDLPLDVCPTDECLYADGEFRRLCEFARDGGDLHRKFVRRRENKCLCRAHSGIHACQ